MTLYRLKWRIARWLVGPIIHDPTDGRDGVFVIAREEGLLMTLETDKFRLKTGMHIDQQAFGDFASLAAYGAVRRWGRFVGTVRYH